MLSANKALFGCTGRVGIGRAESLPSSCYLTLLQLFLDIVRTNLAQKKINGKMCVLPF